MSRGLGMPGLCEHVECHDVAESETDMEMRKAGSVRIIRRDDQYTIFEIYSRIWQEGMWRDNGKV